MAKFKLYYEEQNSSPLRQLWQNFSKNHAAIIGLWSFIALILVAAFAPWIVPYSSDVHHQDSLLLPPAWSVQGEVYYMLGTDDLGRDILSRIIMGARLTFGLGIACVLIAFAIGLVIGSAAGLSRGVKSSFLNHLLDITLTIPSLLIAIIIVAVLGPGLINTMWAVILALLPQFIHSIRNLIQEELDKDYIVAHKLDGASQFQILFAGIMPNVFEHMVIMATMAISTAVLDIAALGFLRLGAQPPSPEWGAMLADSLDLLYIAPWTVYLPGILLFTTILSTNLVGDGLREALSKRLDD